MTRKVILDVDPGFADAMAMCLALGDSRLDVVAITATGGVVSPDKATRNVQAIVEQLDPKRLPRLGAAESQQALRTDGHLLHGIDGLCGAKFRVAELHHRHSSVKIIIDEVRAAPGEVTIIACGPLTNLAAVLKVEPDLATQLGHLIILGGTLAGPGDVTSAAEFNIFCDAPAAQLVFQSPITKTLVPIDVSTSIAFDYGLLDLLPDDSTGVGRVMRAVLPGAFRAFRQRLGFEGVYAPEAVAVVAALHPELLTTESLFGEVEVQGDLTHGVTILDRRRNPESQPNMDVVVDIDTEAALDCILRGLTTT